MGRYCHLITGSVAFFAAFAVACAAADPAPSDGLASAGEAGSGAVGGSGGANPDGGSAGTAEESVVFVAGVVVATLAGSAQAGQRDGPAVAAQFSNPVNLVVSPQGDTLVCDFDNGAIRRVSADGEQVETLFRDALLVRPFGIALDPAGKIYVQADGNLSGKIDTTTGTVWRIDPDTGEGVVLAENVGRPRGLAWRDDGLLVLVDFHAHVIRLMDPETSEITLLAGVDKEPGFVDGTGANARFHSPGGAAWSAQGELVVADFGNHAVRIVTHDGAVKTLAGTGKAGMVDGDASSARFSGPKDVAITADGTVYVTDTGNHRIRRIKPGGLVETLAGSGVQGYNNGDGPDAKFFGQEGLDVHQQSGSLIVADGNGGEPLPFHRLRVVSLTP